jgi:hypothetical protein
MNMPKVKDSMPEYLYRRSTEGEGKSQDCPFNPALRWKKY